MEIIFGFILKLIELGLAYYLIHNIFSKNTKSIDCSFDQEGIKISSKFFKK